ncbi:hypothetical protein ACXO2W_08680 [Lactobacillus delbrueckii subsp. bulgaricus]
MDQTRIVTLDNGFLPARSMKDRSSCSACTAGLVTTMKTLTISRLA